MKEIQEVHMKVSDIGTGFGNPRKISSEKRKDLDRSIDSYGDFGVIVIDENNDVISGNQRLSVLKEKDPDTVVLCKKLVGYTREEKRAINIKANTHAGDWDLDMLADWTADLTMDLGIDPKSGDAEKRSIPEMEPIHYEKYDYVMIVCRSELDYNDLVRKLGIEGKKVRIAKRKINARAVWYDKMDAVLLSKEEYKELKRKAEKGK